MKIHTSLRSANHRPLFRAASLFPSAIRAATACLVAAFVLYTGAPGNASPQLLNTPAPDFLRTDLHGAPVHLKAYRGKVVLLNFWATWCAPCLLEMPRFAHWQTQFAGQGFQVFGISMDDTDTPVRRLQSKLPLNYPLIMGDEKLGELYGGILGLPVTYLIDRQGRIRARFQGETDLAIIEKDIRTLLVAPTARSPHP